MPWAKKKERRKKSREKNQVKVKKTLRPRQEGSRGRRNTAYKPTVPNYELPRAGGERESFASDSPPTSARYSWQSTWPSEGGGGSCCCYLQQEFARFQHGTRVDGAPLAENLPSLVDSVRWQQSAQDEFFPWGLVWCITYVLACSTGADHVCVCECVWEAFFFSFPSFYTYKQLGGRTINSTKPKRRGRSDTYQIFTSGNRFSGIWINSHKLHTHIRDIHTYIHTQIHYPCVNLNENKTKTKGVNTQKAPQK